jgi:hypothetical protein
MPVRTALPRCTAFLSSHQINHLRPALAYSATIGCCVGPSHAAGMDLA